MPKTIALNLKLFFGTILFLLVYFIFAAHFKPIYAFTTLGSITSTSFPSCSQTTVNWNRATPNGEITEQTVASHFNDGTSDWQQQFIVSASTTSVTFNNVNGVTYTYWLGQKSTDGSYYWSSTGPSVTQGCPAPVPGAFTLSASAVSCSQINLSWTSSSNATSYDIYRGGVYLTSTVGTSYSNTGLSGSSTYSYQVLARNSAGSTWSNLASATTPSCIPPPGAFTLSASAVSCSQINLSWTSSSNATSYSIYRGGSFLTSTVGTSYSNTGLAASTTYSYQILASNTAGSTWSNSASATTTSCASPPNTPTLISPANGSGTLGNWITSNPTFTATVSDPNGDNVRAYFNFLAVVGNPAAPSDQNGTTVTNGSNSTWTSVSLSDGKYDWRALAIDTGGLQSSYTSYWRVKKDSNAPTASCGAPTRSGATINIPSLSGTDPVVAGTPSGIQNGTLERSINGGSYTTVFSPAGSSAASGQEYITSLSTSFSESGNAGNSYTYRFSVRDGANNTSSIISCGSVVIPDYTLGWGSVSNPQINPGQSVDYTIVVTPNCSNNWSGSLAVAIASPVFSPSDGHISSVLNSGSNSVTIACPATTGSVIYTVTADGTTTRGNTYTVTFNATSPIVNRSIVGSLGINDGQWLQTRSGDFYTRGNISFSPGSPSGKYTSDYLLKVGGTNTGGTSSMSWAISGYGSLYSQVPTYNSIYLQAGGSTIANLSSCTFNNSTKPTTQGIFQCPSSVTIGQAPGLFNNLAKTSKSVIVSIKQGFVKRLKGLWEFANRPIINKALAATNKDSQGKVLPAGTSGPNYPGTAANNTGVGTVAWISPNNALTNDANYSYVELTQGKTSNYLYLTNYAFSVPAGATINGIEVSINGFWQLLSGSGGESGYFQLLKNGALTGSAKFPYVGFTMGASVAAGGPTDLWGASLTSTDVNNANFGIAAWLATDASPQSFREWINYITIKVYYTTGGGGGTGVMGTLFSSTAPSLSNQAWNYTMGWSFTVSSNGQITGLGGYFSGTKTVTVWNSGGTQLASQSLTCSNSWCVTNLASPVSVSTGVTYYVGVYVNSSGGAYFSSFAPQTSSGVTVQQGWYQTGNVNLPLSAPTNSGGGFYGTPDIVFTASATPPTLTSPTASSITSSSATLGANLTSTGGGTITARGTCWGTSPNPTTNCVAEGGTALGVYSHNRTGLPANTFIYYRGYASNGTTGYSPDGTFTTPTACTATAPNSPGLTAPANGQTNVSLSGTTLTWTAPTSWGTECTTSTRSYRVYLHNGVNPPTTIVGSPAETTLIWNTGALPAGSTWYWKIGAVNKDGLETQSSVYSFTVGATLATPTTLFVNGDLTINDNLSYDSNKMVAIFVNGQIKIKSTVTTINAYLYAENGITTSYDTTAKVSPLVINGGVIIGNGANGLPVVVSFNRNVNNATTTAAEQILYDPRILTSLITNPNDTNFGNTNSVFTEVSP